MRIACTTVLDGNYQRSKEDREYALEGYREVVFKMSTTVFATFKRTRWKRLNNVKT